MLQILLRSATEVRELYCVSTEVDFEFGLQQGWLCNSDLSGLKLSVNIANLCYKLLCTELREAFRKQTLYVWDLNSKMM